MFVIQGPEDSLMTHPTILKRVGDSDLQAGRRLRKFTTSLPPDVLRDASKRLAICALVMAGLFLVWIVVYPLLPLRLNEPVCLQKY